MRTDVAVLPAADVAVPTQDLKRIWEVVAYDPLVGLVASGVPFAEQPLTVFAAVVVDVIERQKSELGFVAAGAHATVAHDDLIAPPSRSCITLRDAIFFLGLPTCAILRAASIAFHAMVVALFAATGAKASFAPPCMALCRVLCAIRDHLLCAWGTTCPARAGWTATRITATSRDVSTLPCRRCASGAVGALLAGEQIEACWTCAAAGANTLLFPLLAHFAALLWRPYHRNGPSSVSEMLLRHHGRKRGQGQVSQAQVSRTTVGLSTSSIADRMPECQALPPFIVAPPARIVSQSELLGMGAEAMPGGGMGVPGADLPVSPTEGMAV